MAIDTSMISRARYFPRFPGGSPDFIPGFLSARLPCI